MTVREVMTYELECDAPDHQPADWETTEWSVDRLEISAEAQGWTSNGEGKHHCPDCSKLELTDEARAERARKLGPGDVPFDGLDL